jgi:hypothetical protein
MLNVFILSVVMLNDFILSVVKPNVFILSVVAPLYLRVISYFTNVEQL